MITVLSIFGMITLSAFANVVYFNPQVEVSNILPVKEVNLITSELKVVKVKLPEIKTVLLHSIKSLLHQSIIKIISNHNQQVKRKDDRYIVLISLLSHFKSIKLI